MEPAILNIKFTQGDDYSLTVTFEDEDGDPINYNGQEFSAQIRPNPRAAMYKDFTIDDADIGDGILVLELASADTATLPPNCTYDVQMVGSETVTIIAGEATVRAQVTK